MLYKSKLNGVCGGRLFRKGYDIELSAEQVNECSQYIEAASLLQKQTALDAAPVDKQIKKAKKKILIDQNAKPSTAI